MKPLGIFIGKQSVKGDEVSGPADAQLLIPLPQAASNPNPFPQSSFSLKRLPVSSLQKATTTNGAADSMPLRMIRGDTKKGTRRDRFRT